MYPSHQSSYRGIRLLFNIALLLTILLWVIKPAKAQVPNTLNYQGVITGTDGKPVADGQYRLTFKLYTQAANGSAIWTETQSTTTINGVFSVLLGKVTPLANIPFDKPYWLGITVGSGSEMTPRVELSASAYSLRARAVADSSVTGSGIASGQVIRSVNGMTDSVSIEAGSNVSIQKSSHMLTISSTGGSSSPWSATLGRGTYGIYYAGGNVGVGTVSPGAMLDVSGSSQLTVPQLWLRDTGANNYSRINFSNASGSNFWAIAGYNNTNPTQERLNFYNHATGDLMSITGDGRVGIGVGTNPLSTSQLTVSSHHHSAGYFSSDSVAGRGLESSSTAITGIGIYSTAGPAGTGIEGRVTNPNNAIGVLGKVDGTGQNEAFGIYGQAGATGTTENIGVYGWAGLGGMNYGLYGTGGGSGSPYYAVYASGDIAYTGSLVHVSDAKFKENVQSVGPVLDKVMELAPKSYTFRKDPVYRTMDFSSGKQYGVIAQQIEKVFPSLVVNATDPGIDPENPKATPHPIHYKGVKYLQMIPILLEAIQEQQKEIQKQQKMIDNLNSEIQSLKK